MARPTKYSEEVEIYSLSCQITNNVRYIGKANDSTKRLKSHLSDSKRRNTPVYCWFRKLSKEGVTPILKIIATVPADQWKGKEIELISQYKKEGHLLNVAIGGDEPFCSKEVRANNGRLNARTIHDSPQKKEMWKLRQALGSSLKWLEVNNRKEKADQIKSRLLTKGITI